jgi:hypothetical protein
MMTGFGLFIVVFTASAVEAVEALTIVLAMAPVERRVESPQPVCGLRPPPMTRPSGEAGRRHGAPIPNPSALVPPAGRRDDVLGYAGTAWSRQ